MSRNLVIGWNSNRGHLLATLGPFQFVYIGLTQRCCGLLNRLERDPERVVFHVDLSLPGLVPVDRLELIDHLRARQISLWNDKVEDITKRRIQAENRRLGLPCTAAMPEGEADEELIVKTNWNCYGESELKMSEEERTAIGYPAFDRSRLGRETWYPVMKRRQMPPELWLDSRLAIEKYITNENGLIFRSYYCGTRAVLTVHTSEQRVERRAYWRLQETYFRLRDGSSSPHANLPALAQKAASATDLFANSFGLDFGAIDMATDGSDVFVIDVNHTPFWGGVTPTDLPLLEHLRGGLV